MVKLSSAVCAISGVCTFDSTVPLDCRKLSRCGICSRSDGTFGLSRKKCTLSNTMLTTCFTPLPSPHPRVVSAPAVTGAPLTTAAPLAATTTVARPALMRRRIPDRVGIAQPPEVDRTDDGHVNPKFARPTRRGAASGVPAGNKPGVNCGYAADSNRACRPSCGSDG